MNCENASPLLYRYADGLLLPDDHDEVARHLNDCAACRARAERIEDIDQIVCSVEDELPSADLRERILSEYRALLSGGRAPKRAFATRRRFARLAASIAIVAAVGVGGYLTGRDSPESPSTPEPPQVSTLHDVFPLRLVERFTELSPDGKITQGTRVKVIQ